jgi:hypothetical protein
MSPCGDVVKQTYRFIDGWRLESEPPRLNGTARASIARSRHKFDCQIKCLTTLSLRKETEHRPPCH